MADPLIGKQLANFKIERLLGRGGMAQVYYAMDVTLHRPVALKIISDFYRDNAAYVERFLREARVVASWRHDNIVQIYYAGEQDGYPFYAMEYIEGEDLGDMLRRSEQSGQLMSHEAVLRIGKAMADALDYAHQHGVVHRDIKPSNVMLARDGRIILTDFGLALELSQGSIGETFGSPHYISPEQAHRSADAVPQSDIYSLGVVLYEMLVGEVPFDGDSITSVAIQVVTQPPPAPRTLNPNLNTSTERVLLKVLSKNPAERHQTANAFIADLETAIRTGDALPETLPPMPAPVVTVTQETRPVRPDRKRGLMYGIVGGVLALGIIAAVLLGLLVLSDNGGGDGDDESNDVASLNQAETETQAAINDAVTPTESTEPRPSASSTTSPPSITPTTAATDTSEPSPTNVPPSATDIEPTNTEVVLTPTSASPASVSPTTIPPTAVPPTAAAPTAVLATPIPTEAYPNGRVFRMYYDNNTFVVANTSTTNFTTNLIGFQALLADGSVAALSNGDPIEVAGTEWSRFYGLLEPNKCITAQISSSRPWLQPSGCRNYNSVITPTRTGNRQFWLPRETIAITEIRVLYQGREAARCPLHNGGTETTTCEVKLP